MSKSGVCVLIVEKTGVYKKRENFCIVIHSQPDYTTGRIALNRFASIQFDYREYVYTSNAESDQFDDPWNHGVFICIVCITLLVV